MPEKNKKKEAKAKAKQEAEAKKTGFLSEIAGKIEAAKSLDDLKAIQPRVFNIWGDDVPAQIQALAAKKGEELQDNENAAADVAAKEVEVPSGWKKVTEEEVKEAEKAGTLVGYDPKKMLALIKEVEKK